MSYRTSSQPTAMGKSKELKETLRAQIIVLFQVGVNMRAIGRALEVPESTVRYTIKRHQSCGTFTSRQRLGRPPMLTDRDSRSVIGTSGVTVKLLWTTSKHSSENNLKRLFPLGQLVAIYMILAFLSGLQLVNQYFPLNK